MKPEDLARDLYQLGLRMPPPLTTTERWMRVAAYILERFDPKDAD